MEPHAPLLAANLEAGRMSASPMQEHRRAIVKDRSTLKWIDTTDRQVDGGLVAMIRGLS
jgi:hypothetical protein